MSQGRLAALFDDHHQRLLRLAQRLSPDAEDARDLAQETFLRAARRLRRIPRGFRREEAWLVRVLVNLARDRWRRERVREREGPALRRDVEPSTNPERAVVARATVRRALAQLPPRRRAVVALHDLEGEEVERIAKLLGITGVTVRWHLAAARRQLAAILLEERGR